MTPIQQIEADAAKNGVRISDACRTAGLDYATWWRWKTGVVKPRSKNLERMASAVKGVVK
jgi:hypothetical protein